MSSVLFPATLTDAACAVLHTADALEKAETTRRFCKAWESGDLTAVGTAEAPSRPARAARPELLPPAKMPRRKLGSAAGRAAFMHAIAHIELNAIDLAWDMIARFADVGLPDAFFSDWVVIADDEARHFMMLEKRLNELGTTYGDLPAHDGLWEAAENTADDVLARLAIVPMVLEARGLDTTPVAVQRLRGVGDTDSAGILQQIGAEEMPHVAAGVRWFTHVCEIRNLHPVAAFHDIIRERFAGNLKPPFNVEARLAAGMCDEYYLPLAG